MSIGTPGFLAGGASSAVVTGSEYVVRSAETGERVFSTLYDARDFAQTCAAAILYSRRTVIETTQLEVWEA